MNDSINWIAINNTLMIKIGFTAILVLLVVYIFRLFFVPKINIVAESVKNKNSDNNIDKNLDAISEEEESTEDDESPPELEESSAADTNEIEQKTLEIQNQKDEILKLNTQLTESATIISDLQSKAENLAESFVKPSAVSAEDTEVVPALKIKIGQLETRLAEYEIIADEIAEIGELRKENIALKKKLEMTEVVDNSPTENTEPPPQADPVSQAEGISVSAEIAASGVNDFLSMQEEAATTEVAASTEESIKLTSEKTATPVERDLIDQFEEESNKKGS